MRKCTFAVMFGNRGFFPETLIAGARKEIGIALDKSGYGAIMMGSSETRYGAIETPEDGGKFARFLSANKGKYDGVIICLPNFGDETGAVAAVRDCGTPVLIQAYPDELNKMDMSMRRDSFCGKFSVMDVLYQYGIPFTALMPHTVHPLNADFANNLDVFAGICKVVNGMRRFTVGAIGARTTAFKTVRFDELTLQKYGITTEALDLSEVLLRVRSLKDSDSAVKAKASIFRNYTCWKGTPVKSFENIVKLAVVLDGIVDDYKMDALALRCWIELEKELKISPCVILSEMNNRGIPAACELDVCNAVAMRALSLASGNPAACLDWNNNYADDPDRCILFHCGPVPQKMMTAKGLIVDHPMFAKALGAGCGFGCNTGRISPSEMTYSSAKTQDGKLHFYLGKGEFTDDLVPKEFFGCAGVARIDGLQKKLQTIGYNGYRHHVSVTFGGVGNAVNEAFTRYLKYECMQLDDFSV
jgi:L-fucose isomerase-like protein